LRLLPGIRIGPISITKPKIDPDDSNGTGKEKPPVTFASREASHPVIRRFPVDGPAGPPIVNRQSSIVNRQSSIRRRRR